jgi:hypothetical protein
MSQWINALILFSTNLNHSFNLLVYFKCLTGEGFDGTLTLEATYFIYYNIFSKLFEGICPHNLSSGSVPSYFGSKTRDKKREHSK